MINSVIIWFVGGTGQATVFSPSRAICWWVSIRNLTWQEKNCSYYVYQCSSIRIPVGERIHIGHFSYKTFLRCGCRLILVLYTSNISQLSRLSPQSAFHKQSKQTVPSPQPVTIEDEEEAEEDQGSAPPIFILSGMSQEVHCGPKELIQELKSAFQDKIRV